MPYSPKSMANIHTLYFLLFLLLDSVFSLRCFECVDPLHLNLACEKNWKEMPTIECRDNEVCTLHVLEKPGIEILHRNCNPSNFCDILKSKYVNVPEVNVQECKICKEDHCNSSITRSGSVVAIGMIICLGILIR